MTLTAYAKMKDVEWQLVSERLHKETLQLRARLRQCAGGGAPGGGCPVDGTTSNMTSSTSSTCGKGGHSTGGGLSIMDRSVRRSLNQVLTAALIDMNFIRIIENAGKNTFKANS